MEISGKIIAVLDARTGNSRTTGNPWMTQDYVLETSEQYPKRMCFNVFGEDKIKQFNIQVGQELTVSFDVDAHEYQGRWFNNIRAWKVEPYVQGAPAATGYVPPVAAQDNFTTADSIAAPETPASAGVSGEKSDELPF